MQLAVQEGLEVHQMDVKTAYLNAPIDVDIYVNQPKGFEVVSKDDTKLVWKLKKSLYGLKQSGRNWNNLLHSYLIDNNFIQSLAEPCVYTKHENDHIIILILWVDDIIIATSNEQLMTEAKNVFKQRCVT